MKNKQQLQTPLRGTAVEVEMLSLSLIAHSHSAPCGIGISLHSYTLLHMEGLFQSLSTSGLSITQHHRPNNPVSIGAHARGYTHS